MSIYLLPIHLLSACLYIYPHYTYLRLIIDTLLRRPLVPPEERARTARLCEANAATLSTSTLYTFFPVHYYTFISLQNTTVVTTSSTEHLNPKVHSRNQKHAIIQTVTKKVLDSMILRSSQPKFQSHQRLRHTSHQRQIRNRRTSRYRSWCGFITTIASMASTHWTVAMTKTWLPLDALRGSSSNAVNCSHTVIDVAWKLGMNLRIIILILSLCCLYALLPVHVWVLSAIWVGRIKVDDKLIEASIQVVNDFWELWSFDGSLAPASPHNPIAARSKSLLL